MAVDQRWIKIGVVTIGVVLLFFVLTQLAVVATVNVLLGSSLLVAVTLNASIELVALALFILPSVWLGLAAAVSRHRGVYIIHTVVTALAFLAVIGIIVYEAVEFGARLQLYKILAGSLTQGLMITKLVLWSVITLMLIILLAFSVSAQCVRRRHPQQEFKYVPHMPPQMPPQMPLAYYPNNPTMEYARPPPVKASPREYPRLVAPPPARYSDYPISPRGYYPPRY